MTLHQSFKAIFNTAGMNKVAFAKRTGIQRNHVYLLLQGHRPVTIKIAQKLCKGLDCDMSFYINKKGHIEVTDIGFYVLSGNPSKNLVKRF